MTCVGEPPTGTTPYHVPGRAGFPARYHFQLFLGHLPPMGNQSQLLAAAMEDLCLQATHMSVAGQGPMKSRFRRG